MPCGLYARSGPSQNPPATRFPSSVGFAAAGAAFSAGAAELRRRPDGAALGGDLLVGDGLRASAAALRLMAVLGAAADVPAAGVGGEGLRAFCGDAGGDVLAAVGETFASPLPAAALAVLREGVGLLLEGG